MPDFNAQNTDAENAKSPPKSVVRDNALSSTSRGSAQKIAQEDYTAQQRDTGRGADVVNAKVSAGR